MSMSHNRHKRPNESEEDEEDFLGFEEEEVYTTPSHNNNTSKRSRKSQHVVKSENPPLPTSPETQHYGYDLQTEEEFIALYQNWDRVDKSVFPPPGPLGLPFEYGWKRELVFRATTGVSKEKGDVYYITPTGRKLRTRNEIMANLGKHLTMDNFSLSKVPLYVGPEYEIVRSAKMKNSVRMPNPREISPSLGKRVPKPKVPKGASPPHHMTTFVDVSGSPTDMETPTRVYMSKVVSPRTPVQVVHRTISSAGGSSLLSKPSAGVTIAKRPDVYQMQVQKPQTKIIQSVAQSPVKIMATAPKRGIIGRSVAQNGNQTLVVKKPAVRPSTSLSMREPANFFRTTAIGYDVLLNVFQCLTVKELLRASRVCRLFNYTAHHPFLWRTVRMKNSHVSDWSGFARALRSNGTRHLDMRKMLLGGSPARVDEQWEEFVKHVSTVEQLEELDLCGRCPAMVVEALYTATRQLRVLNAQSIKDSEVGLTLAEIEYMTDLEELRLRPENWMCLRGTMAPLSALLNLKHLSLTMLADLSEDESHVTALAHLMSLETLELGDCSRVIYELAEHVLPNMQLLRRLRLEKGAAETALMLQVASMPSLEQLELINFDIKAEFNETLSQCLNLRKLMVIPTYLTQSATTNHLIMSGLLGLGATLQVFTWVVTQELLRVTELYRTEGETIELIPIIKPVPGEEIEEEVVLEERNEAMAEVEMVPLSRVQEILQVNLPETYISILKEDMQRTWRLNIVDT